MSETDEPLQEQAIEQDRADLAAWREWAMAILKDWGGYEEIERADAESRTLLGLTFGFTLARGGLDGIKRNLRTLAAHHRGVVRLTDALLTDLDQCSADGVSRRRYPARDHGGDGTDGTTSAGERMEHGAADTDQGAQPKL